MEHSGALDVGLMEETSTTAANLTGGVDFERKLILFGTISGLPWWLSW